MEKTTLNFYCAYASCVRYHVVITRRFEAGRMTSMTCDRCGIYLRFDGPKRTTYADGFEET